MKLCKVQEPAIATNRGFSSVTLGRQAPYRDSSKLRWYKEGVSRKRGYALQDLVEKEVRFSHLDKQCLSTHNQSLNVTLSC